jgi:hypothetical protein
MAWFLQFRIKACVGLTDPEGPALIFYAALQHGFHFTFYSFRASAAHKLSPFWFLAYGD